MPEPHGLAAISARLDKLYEFDREPIGADKLKDGRYFAALFSGEHVAATEFVIGALFVKWGAGARDLLLGLVLGNLLAVLSWAFICAPIAVRTRLTLYWYLRRIAGPGLTVIYNIVNAFLYCILAGAMIAVSASAVSLAVNVKHPDLNDLMPKTFGWVVLVLVVGAVVVSLAIMGFKRMSQFSTVCSPWMFLIFIAGALATLPRLGEFHSLGDLWSILSTKVWNGTVTVGTHKLGFWHVTFFAWFCNLAMHVGLSDMALFRYARRWTYGFYSAFGMYLGHFLSWVCAGLMGATVAGLNPGQMAYGAAGLAGPIAVLLAGWTTANPTLYRAGLALQIVTPNWARWKITLVAGAATTILACFPVFFMKLLDFVAIYGLTLMPIGAIVFTEHWLFPRLGLRQYWAEKKGVWFNIPALVTWVVVLVVCFPIEQFTNDAVRSPMQLLGVHLFFRWLPGWFIAVILYPLLCCLMTEARSGAGVAESPAPRAADHVSASAPRPAGAVYGLGFWVSGAVALAMLILCVVLPLRVFLGGAAPDVYQANMVWYKQWLFWASVVYFVSATIWYGQRERAREQG